MEDTSTWRLDKSIPVVSIASALGIVFLQTVVVTSYLAILGNRVSALEDHQRATATQSEKIAVIEEKVTSLTGTVRELENYIRRNIPQRNSN